jgi:asparagine synthase (glutamine-hydrolysing)
VYDSLIPDRERYYAGLVARHLDIPIRFRTDDENRLFEVFPDADLRRIPDPVFIPAFGPDSRQDGLLAMAVADGARVAFHGEGGDDALFYEWKPYLKFELARGHFASLLRDAVSFPFLFGRLPISRKKNEKSRIPGYVEECPAWFRPEFAARLGLDERYREIRAQVTALPHPARPSGYSKGFAPAGWQFLAENYDPEVTGLPIEVRHPYLDLRMLRYLLSVPVIPWCRNKYLLRRAFSRYLPAEVIERPKKGMSGFPTFESWKLYGIPQNLPREVAAEYVNFEVLEPLVIDSPQSLGDSLRPFALGIFLAQRRSEML